MASWTTRMMRILRHRWLDRGDTRRALSDEALARIEERVMSSERGHSGEIRVCVEAGLPIGYLQKDLGPRARAITLFGKLRVWDTAANNGVLIYLLLAEHAIEVVADRGLNDLVSPTDWQAIVGRMRQQFQGGQFEQGLNAAIDEVDALLTRHFPLQAGQADRNELPDRVDLR